MPSADISADAEKFTAMLDALGVDTSTVHPKAGHYLAALGRQLANPGQPAPETPVAMDARLRRRSQQFPDAERLNSPARQAEHRGDPVFPHAGRLTN
jgi:hypothetical protein